MHPNIIMRMGCIMHFEDLFSYASTLLPQFIYTLKAKVLGGHAFVKRRLFIHHLSLYYEMGNFVTVFCVYCNEVFCNLYMIFISC